MGAGKVAPAALMVSAGIATAAASPTPIAQSVILFMSRSPLSDFRLESLLQGRSGARQSIAEVEEQHAEAGIFRLSAGDEPRIADQVGVLAHEVEGPPLGILPDGLVEAERDFLNGAVLPVSGPDVAVADQHRLGDGGVDDHVLLDVSAAVVGVEQRVLVRVLEAGNRRSGVNERHAAICAGHQVGRQAEDVTAAAIAPIVVRDNPEAGYDLKIEVQETSPARRVVVVGAVRIPHAELAHNAADFAVEFAGRI